MAEWITLDTHHGPVRAWQALPDGTARGGLVVVQEIFGANPHIRSVAERFAAEGYAVLAPSFFDLVDGPDADPDALPYDAEGVKQGAKGDCLKGEFAGSGGGLLSLPALAYAAAAGKCAK